MTKQNRKSLAKQTKMPQRKPSDSSTPVMTYIGVFGICAYLLCVGLAQIFLQNKTARVENQIHAENERLRTLRKVCNNLNLDRERHKKASFILPRARQLGLHPPLPGQLRHMPGIQKSISEPKNIVDRNE